STDISGTFTYGGDGLTATFTPTVSLPDGSLITVTIATDVLDLSANGMLASKTWSFTTATAPDLIAPTVVWVNPSEDATGIASDSQIEAHFSEAMNTATINSMTFKVASGSTDISGTFTYGGDGLTATFTPTVSLPDGSLITVTIATDVLDLSANGMLASKTWSFTTLVP
ncbi:MAG TPA: Ig-like domain-containing protein, partial [Candidatus Rifleibacterium sp.]|nr:Ig-like domain-containing protein [Candidatus Rifleibacterium sp.]